MKRVLSLVVAVVLTFSVLNVTWVYAIEPYEMQPNYIGVATMKPGLTLNTGGLMTCTDNIEIKTGYTAKVVWSLQYQSNRNWISTQTWKDSNKKRMSLNKTVAVVSGRNYRLQTVATVYDANGKVVETVTKVSESTRT